MIDPDVVAANLAAAARQAGDMRIRPHFKAHTCVSLLRRQQTAPGHAGVTCATAGQALVPARAGIGDLPVASDVVGRTALGELAEAAGLVDVIVAVDSGDADHGRLGLGFAQAVWCVATVVSRRGATAVLNAGLEHLNLHDAVVCGDELWPVEGRTSVRERWTHAS